MFRPIRMDHTNCLQVAIKTLQWRFICINGEKTFKTIWKELEVEFPTIFNNCSVQLLENATTTQVGHYPLTDAEQSKRDAGITEETIAIDRLWKKLITSLQTWQPNKIRRQKEREKKGVGYHQIIRLV